MKRGVKAKDHHPKTPSPAEALLFEGALVKHKDRYTGFGVSKTAGIIRGFIEPKPGWHRALVAWKDEDGEVEAEQYVDTDKLEIDAIGTLGKMVSDAGLQMTLFGVPVTTEELRTAATERAMDRIEHALNPAKPPMMEDDRGRRVPLPEGAVVAHGFVFPPGTDIERDVKAKAEDPSGRPTMPIGKVFP